MILYFFVSFFCQFFSSCRIPRFHKLFKGIQGFFSGNNGYESFLFQFCQFIICQLIVFLCISFIDIGDISLKKPGNCGNT